MFVTMCLNYAILKETLLKLYGAQFMMKLIQSSFSPSIKDQKWGKSHEKKRKYLHS